MKILFAHQNMPGQYRELVQYLAAQGGHELVFLTQRIPSVPIAGVKIVPYRPHHVPSKEAYGLSKPWEEAAGAGFGAMMAARELERTEGFRPDLILGHTGWGELLFFKQLWPDVPVLGFFEYYYRMQGGLVGFDPAEKVSEHTPYFNVGRNAVPLASIEAVDQGHVPTVWQRDRFPASFRDRMYVCHDGIRTDRLMPDPQVRLSLGRLDRMLTREDEVFTYMARNMEKARGFPTFMRALPKILAERPAARVLVIGGNETSYGRESTHPGGLRGEMEAEVGDSIDWDRVHFLGRVPYEVYCQVIQLSRCHIYLTMPFVLSWSLLEVMAMQATVVASDVAPVREAITHGQNGLLVDFFDPDRLADQVVDVLANPGDHAHLGPAARAHVVETYDFLTRCLPVHVAQMNALVPQARRIVLP
ncbi:GDP-mannose-dependent alpha-(1-6)-phosphatidylinositol monomannoside mannosyltransferase (plasmid) [Roseovarius sp. THAF27]|uniref:glycosyltransferase family 4 protein n=1 Tax=unclassified Roseovarius TaxID=2614913 RepID=UPI001268A142|nr:MULTISPECIES: glycosyltransferase family 4 protein [unclassified Roseovarius]QFT83302.1 GDP-mannose-dependent alpha-(1-6)-phosphatidylinositol monomannoside mannosyltransferase [Roseovarius sp. THAF27]QFT99936.1 GDP-mannose-dependent alpha-(1-6)-phosphatidylinositol monomannoside mannosyltransferase [Roseovarius sp. THAF8]